MTTATITLPFESRQQTYDRDKLQTAVLVYRDMIDVVSTMHVLCGLHGFARTDATTYAVGARICVENGIEP